MTQKQLEGHWLKALMFTLFGFAVLGKGFAYLFVGEMVLAAGFLIYLRSRRVMLAFSDPILILWTVFAFWGFCRTVTFLSEYRFDAVRDAVLWGYGVFALLIAAFVNSSSQISIVLNTYRKFIRWYLPILPLILLLSGAYRESTPKIPWAPDIPIVFLKVGDAAVHLAAIALFMMIFSDRQPNSRSRSVSVYKLLGLAGWFLSALFVLIRTRGGFLAMTISIALASIVDLKRIGWKVAAFAMAGSLAAILLLGTGLLTVKIGSRAFTLEQVSDNITSLAGGGGQELESTTAWRLLWWKKIINYTMFGKYFWTGKGFGVNLAVDDGNSGMTAEETALRSPHNGSMTVLARMGVPGIVLWVALNSVFVIRLVKGYLRSMRSGSRFWSSLNLWILCYWLAAFINMSFDVDLEGPQGGIWFWSIIGFGVAALRIQAYEARQLHVYLKNRRNESSEAALSAVSS